MTVRSDAAAAVAALLQRERAAPGDAKVKLSLALALRATGDAAAAERKAAEAVALAPGDARARHVLGFMLRERGALGEAAAQLLEARRLDNDVADPFHLAALTLHALRRRGELAELASPRDAGQRFGETMLKAIAAYEAGDVEGFGAALRSAATIVDRVPPAAANRGAFETYRAFLARLLEVPPARARDLAPGRVHVVGDSHSLTMAHRLIDTGDGMRRLEPSLIFGCMAWHLASPNPGPQSAAFDEAIAACTEGATLLACFGELDCRSTGGLFKRLRSGAERDAGDATSRLADGYLARLQRAAGTRLLRVIVVVPPAARVDDSALAPAERALFRAIAPGLADALRRGASDLGWPVIDLAAVTRDADGRVSGVHHVDSSHVVPAAFVAAAQRAGFRAA